MGHEEFKFQHERVGVFLGIWKPSHAMSREERRVSHGSRRGQDAEGSQDHRVENRKQKEP